MGSCLEHPFDLYYRPDALSRLGISTLSHAAFTRWAAAAPTDQPPSARLLAIIDHNQLPSAPPQGSVSYDHTTPARDTLAFLAQERQFCLRNNAPINPKHPSKQLTLNFQPFPPLTIVSPLRWQKSAAGRDKFAKLIIDSARQSDAISPPPAQANRDMSPDKRSLFTGGSEPPQEAIIPDALVVNYELRYPFLDPSSTTSQLLLQYGSTTQPPAADLKPFEHFPYAPAWVQLAESLLAQAPALVGLHWRQENIPVPDLQRCASSLLLTLDSLKTAYPSLEAVYLSTDYPIEQAAPDDQHPSGGRASSSDREVQAHSGTFSKSITQDHHRMMRALLAQPVALRWLTFNGLLDSLDLDHDLLDKLLQLSVFSTAKETARLMKVARKADSAQEWSDGQRPEEEDKAHRREVSRLVKDTLRLRAGPSGGAGEPGKPVDIGVVAIVEKLLLVRASVFLTGVPGQCSKRSSFTNQVVLHRQRLIDRSFLATGVLTDSDYPGNPSPSLQRFNLVEFWGPSE
ncbi:hypothetical protein PtA15_15A395 [Puccinia triticina]|uniref:Uncharacterized protein n=1 Tax=Puccinia triticina TaxID=208348 RepID=A0ABY7D325_9BASI|nr:uncharacterized protein PtA15_15A395 [Puccinia triticina]WAQ92001.1 hypothetical protein PtA15_15A395 [Puccinia triticina]